MTKEFEIGSEQQGPDTSGASGETQCCRRGMKTDATGATKRSCAARATALCASVSLTAGRAEGCVPKGTATAKAKARGWQRVGGGKETAVQSTQRERHGEGDGPACDPYQPVTTASVVTSTKVEDPSVWWCRETDCSRQPVGAGESAAPERKANRRARWLRSHGRRENEESNGREAGKTVLLLATREQRDGVSHLLQRPKAGHSDCFIGRRNYAGRIENYEKGALQILQVSNL